MKALFALALLVVACFASDVDETTHNLMVGTWYGYTDAAAPGCCIPGGVVEFHAQPEATFISATKWTGAVCSLHSIFDGDVFAVPFQGASNYLELPQFSDTDDWAGPTDQHGFVYLFNGLSSDSKWKNGTDQILIAMTMLETKAQLKCQFILSKASTLVGASVSALVALVVAFVAF